MRHIFWYQVQFSILAFLEKNAAIQYSQKRMQSQPEPWSSPFSLQPKIFCYVGLFYQQKREGERERERELNLAIILITVLSRVHLWLFF